MQIKIHGDKIQITESMQEYVEEKLAKLEKYLESSSTVNAKVIVKVKKNEQTVEITIPLKTVILRSEETKDDFYAAVDKAVDKLERQIRKNKTKLTSKHTKSNVDFVLDSFNFKDEEEVADNKIVKRKQIEIKPMSEEEAILQMDLLGHQFYMFKNADTDKVALVYRRNDGDYGIIESE